jgi:1-aminocyclopropane-1-carboxylate deaminase/D-cysteine desulfhydrase-like pyridoxal-dependent ACC family enzyme
MMYIETAEHSRLVTELETLRNNSAAQLQQAVAAEKASGTAALEQALLNKELGHKAHIAGLTAQVEQQVREISVLRETIANLKHEIAEQRSLTKEVAVASSKSQIQQSFGGKQ